MRHRPLVLLLTLLGSAALATTSAAVPDPPDDFVVEDAAPGAGFIVPISMAFLPDGRFLVGEKRGRVFEVRGGIRQTNPLVAIDAEVLNANDRGLMGIAVDPNYFVNHYIYLVYTVDPDSNGTETNNDAFARLARYTVNFTDSASVIPSSRTILMGVTWPTGPVSCSPSHTVGALRWGEDGSLLIASGDGAQFTGIDAGGQDSPAFTAGRTDPYEDIGSFRSQYIGSLAGKILRINPANGHGYPSNPFATGDLTEPRSKVWAYGVRNPYRFGVRPGTGNVNPANGDPGTIYVGDVGWNTYEELDVAATGGKNFGWPCYEGIGTQSGYQSANPAHNGCGSFGTPDNPSQHTTPVSQWHHGTASLSVPPGIIGSTTTAGQFYSGTTYPAIYRGQFFYADYTENWIRVAVVNGSDQLQQSLDFGTGYEGPVDFASHPVTKDLYYVSINTSQVRRIRYTGPVGGNTPPVAQASGAPLAGQAPLTVNFSSAGTSDVDGDTLSYTWLFGDGGSSTLPNPSHVYSASGVYTPQLAVSDGHGGLDVETVTITVLGGSSEFPSTGVLDTFNRPNGPIGPPWVDATAGLNVSGNTLTQSVITNSTVWNGATFGKNQEAYFTFVAASPTAAEQNLMLKVQGTTWSAGHIEVAYNATQGRVNVNTYAPSQGWAGRGSINGVTFNPGDQFGARVDSLGQVRVYKNGALIGVVFASEWPFATNTGRIGLTLSEINGSVLDDFGGGTVINVINTPPTAQIVAPSTESFFHEGEQVALIGTGTDSQTPSQNLTYTWVIDLHHNIHIHPAVYTFNGPNAVLPAENHDDGSGVFYRINLIVADPGGLSDTASVDIYPEVDLEPGLITTIPSPPIVGEPVEYRGWMRNLGRLPAPVSRWSMLLDAVQIAARDTIVPAQDSVRISVFGVAPALGAHSLRLRADTLGAVTEIDESNNARMAAFTVVAPSNTPPLAAIAAPDDSAFFAAGDSLTLVSASTDAEDPAAALTLDWIVTLHRAAGDSLLATLPGDSAGIRLADFEDGGGVSIGILLRVTDTGGLLDSAAVSIRPECDLTPGPIATNAGHLAAGEPVAAGFWLRNLGGHSTRLTRWRLLLDGGLLAEGDRRVGAADSSKVQIAIPGGLTGGPHAFRAVADTLGELAETDEANNGSDLEVTVPGVTTGAGESAITRFALSAPRPNPSGEAVELTLELPEAGTVSLEVLDVQGRQVSARPGREYGPGRWTLRWDGRREDGRRAGPGRYFLRVRAAGVTLTREITRLR